MSLSSERRLPCGGSGMAMRAAYPRFAAVRLASVMTHCYQERPFRAAPAMTTVATFELEYLQYLGPDGRLVRDDLPAFARDAKTVVELHKEMLKVRTFDTKAVALQRTGKLGTYA